MRLRIFGGKGGVGKTTLAAAAAVGAAESRRKVLVVSTDPAHSLGDALALPLGPEPRPVHLRQGTLLAAEVDAEAALSRWLGARREALLDLVERGTYLDREDAASLLDLELPGIDELTGLLETVRTARGLGCDELVLDTAPTAHTLRLLGMPATLRGFGALMALLAEKPHILAESFGGGGGRAGAGDFAAEAISGEAREIEALLRDSARTAFTWVLLPEAMSVAESRDGLAALAELAVPVSEVVVNRLTPPDAAARCPICAARRGAELEAVEMVRWDFAAYPLRLLPAQAREPRGLPALRLLAGALSSATRGEELLLLEQGMRHGLRLEPAAAGTVTRGAATGSRARGAAESQTSYLGDEPRTGSPERSPGAIPPASSPGWNRPASSSPPPWLATLAPPERKLLLVGGKGGVGKTTCAAAVALGAARARPRRRVLLLSADPAHSLGDALLAELGDEERRLPGGPANLRCREIDPGRAMVRWRERFGEATGDVLVTLTGLPATTAERATADLLGLEPPGLDELAALDALTDAFPAPPARPAASLVVVDTAPTGHALRLLAMPEVALAWDHALLALLLKYREAVAPGELAAELVTLSRSLKRLAALLADPRRTAFAVVTRPAELPRRETLRLLDSLREARIAPAAVLVNAVPALPEMKRLSPPASPPCPRCRTEAMAAARQIARLSRDLARRDGCAIILAPAAVPPPRGCEGLLAWSGAWREGPP